MQRFILLLTVFFLFIVVTFSVAQTPQYYNFQNVGASSNSFPFGTTAGKQVQWLVLPNEINQPSPVPTGMRITTLYFFMTGSATPNFTNLTIKMGHTSITTLPTASWYTGDLDTVYHRASVTLSSSALSWMSITLDEPFDYDPSQSLIIDVNQCGATSSGMTVRQNALTDFRRSWSATTSPCPFNWGGQSEVLVNLGVDVEPVPPSVDNNYTLLLPTPGVNTNYVAIPHQAGMVGFPNITIEAWVKTGGSTTANTVLNKGATSFDYQLGINSGGIPFFRAQGVVSTSTGLLITPGIWTHLAVTYDGSNVRFYKDGTLVSTVPFTGALGSSVNEMRIGRGGSDPGSGNLDEVRLWSVARTQGEIDSNRCRKYPASFTSSTGLKALWHLDSTLIDSISGFNGNVMGNVGYDTVSFPIPGLCEPLSISNVGNIIPEEYTLSQNYPNPFNPVTRIEFAIPKGEFVELKIYDIAGKEVATIIKDPLVAGSYIVDFDARTLSSGIYFYTLTAGQFKDTKKMLLIK
jgi:hypothetical protein